MAAIHSGSLNCAERSVAAAKLFLALSMVTVLLGCKAGEGRSTGFAPSTQMSHDPQLPFQKSWHKPGLDYHRYSKIYVAEVNTDYMLQQTDWQKGERKEQIQGDVKKLGAYTKHRIEKAFRDDPQHRFEVLDAPSTDPAALQFELALTEVVPSKVTLNALGYAPFGIGLGVSAVRAIAQDSSSVAFEARVRDAATGEVVAMAADRESEQWAPVTVRGLTWYSHAEAIIAQWSTQFVQVFNRKPGETVKGTAPITLQPW